MRRGLRGLGLLLACSAVWLCVAQVQAQDALGPGADFSDDWDAIMKAAPPPGASAKGARAGGAVASSGSRGSTHVGSSASEAPRKSAEERAAERAAQAAEENEARESRRRTRDEALAARAAEESEAREARRRRRDEALAARAAEEGEAREVRESRRRARDEALAAAAGAEGERQRLRREERAQREAEDERRREERASEKRRSKDDDGQEPSVAALGPNNYESLIAFWHASWPENDAQQIARQTGSVPALSLHPVGRWQTPYVLIPQGVDGGFDDAQVEVASKAFGSWQGGPRVSARLLDLIYHAAQHFDVYHVHLVSGVRHDRSGSRHSHALAADIVLPGVEDEELAAYFRPQGFCGVGIYTRAGFVHIDVRERSYFWLDKSPPGRRTRIIPVRGDEAKAADEAAVVRGQNGYVNPPRLQKALHARVKRRMAQAKFSQ